MEVSVWPISKKQTEHLAAEAKKETKCHVCSQTQGLTQVTVVGHDWGGVFAWNMALCYPERVRYVVLTVKYITLFTHNTVISD